MTTTAPPPSAATVQRKRAQIVARLRHPNLVRMLPLPAGGGLLPVVEEARPLADFTLPAGTFKRFDLEQVVRLMLDVLSGLGALHVAVLDEPFVHAEVCPRYVYVGEHGSAKLVPLTSTHLNGVRLEPNGYLAPELLLGESADARADLFSVGVMLWEALAGRRLFPDPSASAVLSVLARPLPPLVLTPRAAWAQALCPIVQRALSRHPAARQGSALELSQAITQAVGHHLDRAGRDTWQDEAPTPVLKPRLHFPPLRVVTPPATVVDVHRAAASSSAPPASADIEVLLESAAQPPVRRRRAVGWVALGAVLLLVGVGAHFSEQAIRLLPTIENPRAAGAAIAAPAALLAAPPSAAPPALVAAAPSVRPTSQLTAAPAPAAVPSATSAVPSASATPRSSSPAPSRATKRLRPERSPAPKPADYGI